MKIKAKKGIINGVETIGKIKKSNKVYYNAHIIRSGAFDDKTERGHRNNKANQRAKNDLKYYVG